MLNSSRVKSIAVVIFSVVAIVISQAATACTMSLPIVHKELIPSALTQTDYVDLLRLNLETGAMIIAPIDIDKDMMPNITERSV